MSNCALVGDMNPTNERVLRPVPPRSSTSKCAYYWVSAKDAAPGSQTAATMTAFGEASHRPSAMQDAINPLKHPLRVKLALWGRYWSISCASP